LPAHISRSSRRLLVLLASLPAAVLLLGTLYMLGSTYLEHSPRGLWQGMEWAAETLTTTGYGADARWHSSLMTLFVIVAQFLGLFLVFMIFPVYVLPYFEERFESRLPRALPEMGGRVLFYRYGPAVDSLIEELQRVRVPFVVLEEEEALARSLRERGYEVVYGCIGEDPAVLAGVESARALVTNADDHADASFIMMAREQGYPGEIYALAENPLHRAPMMRVGATAVYTPSHILGAALAARASARISPRVEGLQQLGERVGMADFRVYRDSPLAGRRLGELGMRRNHGVTVIGQWHGGHFETAAGPETRIEAGGILVTVGAHDNLTKVERLAAPIHRAGPIIVAGYGTVGRKVAEMLRDAGETTIVIDERPESGVDVVGNVLEHDTLERARVREASAVVLALSNDSAGVFATAVVRDYAPEMPLIARVNRAPNVARLYQAGADFALSVGQVAGQILAYHLLGEHAVAVEQRLKCARMGAGTMAGLHPWRAQVRERTGAAVVAVERDKNVYVEFDDDFRVGPDDVLFVCGTGTSLDSYLRVFQAAPAEPPR